jgi:hypothetical protein
MSICMELGVMGLLGLFGVQIQEYMCICIVVLFFTLLNILNCHCPSSLSSLGKCLSYNSACF